MTAPTPGTGSMSSGERWVVVGGLGLAVASLVPWYEPDELVFVLEGSRTNGWEAPDATLSIVATVAGAALAVVVLAVGRGPTRPGAWGTLLTAGSAAVFGLVSLKFSLNTDGTTVGIYLALAAAVTQLYGAYVTKVEEAPATTTPASARPPPPAATAAIAADLPPGPPASPAAADPNWPETSYFLGAWLRPGGDPAAAVAAYRLAFANDAARQARLALEVHTLLNPTRSHGERAALVTAFAPYVRAHDASAVLLQIAHRLAEPAP